MVAMTPLICFEIVEMHLPDRVFRQFGLRHYIPDAAERVARINRASKRRYDRSQELSAYISR